MTFAYEHNKERDNIILHLNPRLAPIKVAIFPIVKTDEKFVALAREVYANLREEWNVTYDDSGSIGRRYSRNDETGTPYCITIDDASLKKKVVTIRNRDTTRQIIVKIAELWGVLRKLVNGEIAFEKAGKIVETRVK